MLIFVSYGAECLGSSRYLHRAKLADDIMNYKKMCPSDKLKKKYVKETGISLLYYIEGRERGRSFCPLSYQAELMKSLVGLLTNETYKQYCTRFDFDFGEQVA